jgi:hypothetical protein
MWNMLVQDLRKLIGFRGSVTLHRSSWSFENRFEGFRELAQNELGLVDLELVDLYHHPHPGAAAELVDW